MESSLENAEKEFEKQRRRLNRLYSKSDVINELERPGLELKIEFAEYQFTKARLFYLGKRMEQAGRDLSKAAKNINNQPGELEIIIKALNETHKNKSIKEEFTKADLNKQINNVYLDRAFSDIEDTYHELFEDDEDEDDEDEDDQPAPEPTKPPKRKQPA